jgi:hypothetical protein
MWAGLAFASGFANGIVELEQLWESDVDNYFAPTDAASIVRVANYEGGSSGIMPQPIISLNSKTSEVRDLKRQFNGKFKQKFDALCYPFDHQEVSFTITIEKPISKYWEVYLLCNEGEEALDAAGNEVEVKPGEETSATTVKVCKKELDSSAVGLHWEKMACTKTDAAEIECTMYGHRLKTRVILNFIMPSLLVSMMSFASFQLPVGMAMPRVATTMIAMLTLINLRNALSKMLPGSGGLSWIEYYFCIL